MKNSIELTNKGGYHSRSAKALMRKQKRAAAEAQSKAQDAQRRKMEDEVIRYVTEYHDAKAAIITQQGMLRSLLINMDSKTKLDKKEQAQHDRGIIALDRFEKQETIAHSRFIAMNRTLARFTHAMYDERHQKAEIYMNEEFHRHKPQWLQDAERAAAEVRPEEQAFKKKLHDILDVNHVDGGGQQEKEETVQNMKLQQYIVMQSQKADLSQAVTEAAQLVHGMKMFGEEGSNKYVGAVSKLQILRQELADVGQKSDMLKAFYTSAQKDRQKTIAADLKRIRHDLHDGYGVNGDQPPKWLRNLDAEARKASDAQISKTALLNLPLANINDARVEQIKETAYQDVITLREKGFRTQHRDKVDELKRRNALAEKLWVNEPETAGELDPMGPDQVRRS